MKLTAQGGGVHHITTLTHCFILLKPIAYPVLRFAFCVLRFAFCVLRFKPRPCVFLDAYIAIVCKVTPVVLRFTEPAPWCVSCLPMRYWLHRIAQSLQSPLVDGLDELAVIPANLIGILNGKFTN